MLSNCRSEVCKALGIPETQCELSMGMTGDFEQAVRNYNFPLENRWLKQEKIRM